MQRSWFSNPNLTGPTPLSIDKDGKVSGHIATWGTCHLGQGRTCLTAPKSRSNYAHFLTGAVLFGDEEIPTGPISVGGGHAGLGLSARGAVEHYDNSSASVADVTCGEDSYGIWVAGAVRPGATPEQVHALRASAPSGDWRQINGSLELVAVLSVNTPGFSVPRVRALRAAGAPEDCDECLLSLVAAGSLEPSSEKSHASDVRPGQVIVTESGPFRVSSVTFSEDGQVRIKGAYMPEAMNVQVTEESPSPSPSPSPMDAALSAYELAASKKDEDPNDEAVDVDLDDIADEVDKAKKDQAKDDEEELSAKLTLMEQAFTSLANRVYSRQMFAWSDAAREASVEARRGDKQIASMPKVTKASDGMKWHAHDTGKEYSTTCGHSHGTADAAQACADKNGLNAVSPTDNRDAVRTKESGDSTGFTKSPSAS